MAHQLIDSLSSDFEPEKYHDEYREKVLELIERKAAGEEIAVSPRRRSQKVPDLMAALEASLAAVKGDRERRSTARRRGARRRSRHQAAARRPRRSPDRGGWAG